jgi:hypothetical protein
MADRETALGRQHRLPAKQHADPRHSLGIGAHGPQGRLSKRWLMVRRASGCFFARPSQPKVDAPVRAGLASRRLASRPRQATPPSIALWDRDTAIGRFERESFDGTKCSGPLLSVQRNLLYTGTTRGKRLVVLVGQKKAMAIAVRNVSGRRRWSKLDEWLRLGASRTSFDAAKAARGRP